MFLDFNHELNDSLDWFVKSARIILKKINWKIQLWINLILKNKIKKNNIWLKK
jgi:hypothetical protein